jgi:hypothetical protein
MACDVTCVWDGSQLILQAEKDFDSNGLALVDEFSDAISACIEGGFDGNIEILSIQGCQDNGSGRVNLLLRVLPLPSLERRSRRSVAPSCAPQ